MGSLFSSAAAAAADEDLLGGVCVSRPLTKEEREALLTSHYVYNAIIHYNSNNPGADFDPVEEAMETKAACVGFRQDFWYHVGFLARRRSRPTDVQRFFAELRFDRRYNRLTVQTCTILEEPLCRFRSRCAFCPDKFQILHPTNAEFACGKRRHRNKFFQEGDMLVRPFVDHEPREFLELVYPDWVAHH